MTTEYRYTYCRCSTRAAAERTLEHFFAIAEICEGERPEIERRGAYWCITLPETEG